MKRTISRNLATIIGALLLPSGVALAQDAASSPPASADDVASEDARLTAFLDSEFADLLRQQPLHHCTRLCHR
jgi:hypothetical protein